MSEGAADLCYLAVALIGTGSAAVKAVALRRGRSGSLVLVVSCHLAGICAFVLAAPAVYRAVDRAAGLPGLASCLVYGCVVVFGAHAHLLAVVWAAEVRGRRVPRARIAGLLTGYAAVLAAMAVTFARARISGPDHPLTFEVSNAGRPDAVVFLGVFLAGLSFSMLSTALECRRGARTGNARAHGIAPASLLILGYPVCTAPAIALAAAGLPGADRLTELGGLSGTAGAAVLVRGLSGPALGVWWRDRRDYRRLRVLWETAVEGAGRTVALAPPGRLAERWSLLGSGAWLLIRRLADICDAERALQPWMDPALARSVAEAAGPATAPEEVRALAAAALLRDAVRRRRDGEPPAFGAPPHTGDIAPEGERGHLVRVARALEHPLVESALRDRVPRAV